MLKTSVSNGQLELLAEADLTGDYHIIGWIEEAEEDVEVEAVTATLTYQDSTPADLIVFTATEAGADGNDIEISITADSVDTLTAPDNIVVTVTGTAIAITYGAWATLAELLAALEAHAVPEEEVAAGDLITAALVEGVDETTAIIGLTSTALTGGSDSDSYTPLVFVANDAAVAEQPPLVKTVQINISILMTMTPLPVRSCLPKGWIMPHPPALTLVDTDATDDQENPIVELVAISLDTTTPANDITTTKGVLEAGDGTNYLSTVGGAAQAE